MLPLRLLLLIFLLLALGLFASKPAHEELPTRQTGILGCFTSMFAGSEEAPQFSDLGMLLLATHRERVFVGVLGRWIEVPCGWKHLLELRPTPLVEDPSAPTVLRLAKSETEARSLRQRGDLAGAAEVYMRLEAAAQTDPEAGICCQRYAEEAGRCLAQAGQAEAALAPLERALDQTRDLRSRRSAAEALAQAALELPDTAPLERAANELFALAEADQGTSDGDLAAHSAFACLRRGYDVQGAAGRFDGAARLLALALERGAALSGGVAPGDDGPWISELEGCIWRSFLAILRRDDGDSVAADLELNRRLRELPALAASRPVAAALDVLQASDDGNVDALEEACFQMDKCCGSLEAWQLDGLLDLKRRILEEDLR